MSSALCCSQQSHCCTCRAFVQQRLLEHGKGGTQSPGPAMLFFGCRRSHQDFLYGDLLEQWHAQGAIELHTAFSRQQVRRLKVQSLNRCQVHSSNGRAVAQLPALRSELPVRRPAGVVARTGRHGAHTAFSHQQVFTDTPSVMFLSTGVNAGLIK